MGKCINGGYINFAVCDFYKDNSFVDLSQMIFKAINNQNLSDLR